MWSSTKMKYTRNTIVPKTTVAGNIRDFRQTYEIFYYPKADDLPDKIAMYIYLENQEKSYAKRSIYFSSTEQLKLLITDLIQSYLYFLDKKSNPVVPREQFRLIQLDSLLTELKEKQLSFWRKED